MSQDIVGCIVQLLTKPHEINADPTRVYHFVTNIKNTSIADKIAKLMQYAPRTLQNAFERGLTLEAGLQLAKGVHLGRSPQVMQISTSVPCNPDNLKLVYNTLMLEIVVQGLMLVESVEDWVTSKNIARVLSILKLVVTEMT